MWMPTIISVVFVLVLSGVVCPKAESQELKGRDLAISKTLDEFDRSVEREKKISAVLEEFERDLKIKRALERLERAQIENSEQFSDDSLDLLKEKVYVRPPVTIRGQLRHEIAARMYETSQITKFKNQLNLTATGDMTAEIRYRVSGRGHYDAAYEIEDDYSRSARSDQRIEAELRETYIDFSSGNWDMRLGKQQVVWGEAIAFFVADIVNAKDLREFVLPEFDSIRIPEWGMSLEYTFENLNSQFIVFPGIEFDKLGVTGSEFAFPLPVPEGIPVNYADAKQPKDGFENSKVGTRINYLLDGLDMGLFYLHSWTSSPVLYRSLDLGVYDFSPEYERLDTFGATFSKAVSNIVFKGDFIYTGDQYFSVIDPTDNDGIVRSHQSHYLLGADYTFFDRLDVSAQFSQRIIHEFLDSMVGEEKYSSDFSLRLSREFWNRKVFTELMAVYGMSAPDFLYRSKLRYNLSDSWQVSVGADIFSGKSTGLFGYFRDRSRYYSEMVYKF